MLGGFPLLWLFLGKCDTVLWVPPPQDKGWEAMGWLEWGHPCSN